MTDTPLVTTRPWVELKRITELDGNWTHTALAAAVGVTKAYVSQLMNGQRQPGRTIIRRFADVLKVPYTMLEPPTPPIRLAYRLDEVAEMIGLDEVVVLQMVQSRQLNPQLVGGHVLISDDALTEFFSRRAEAEELACGDAA